MVGLLRSKERWVTWTGAGQPREHWIAQAYDTLGPDLYRHAHIILADPALAEDAVQQAFTRLLTRGRMDDVVSLHAFLHVIVRHEAYRLLARRKPLEPLEHAQPHLLDPVGAALEQYEEHHQLEQALLQLAPEQREVVYLKFYEQLTFAQIAALLNISSNTAASRYRYALTRLRELLPAERMET